MRLFLNVVLWYDETPSYYVGGGVATLQLMVLRFDWQYRGICAFNVQLQ